MSAMETCFVWVRRALVAMACAGGAQAKTVALWPLDYDAGGAFDGRCAVDARYDMSVVSESAAPGGAVPWNLPPCPDGVRTAFAPVSRSAVRMQNASAHGFLSCDAAGAFVRRDRDFTLEGWLRLRDLPASNDYAVVATGSDYDYGGNRWTLTLRRRAEENYAASWILWANGGNDALCFADADEAASYARTNDWLHVALVHHAGTSGGRDAWQLYLDGAAAGAQQTFWYSVSSVGTPRLDLGGRRSSDKNNLVADFDYWRLSDACLEPDQLLCAGVAGATVSVSHTVAYWPLGVTAAGNVDGRDAVGEAFLTSGLPGMAGFFACRMGASEEAAFDGQPPNATVTLPDGNAGALQGAQTGGCLMQQAVGAALDLSRSFTVEGWFAPRICERAAKGAAREVACYLFGTRPDYEKGWAFQYRATGRAACQFDLYCIDQDGELQKNVKLSGSFDMAGWHETWRHVALVYDAAGGERGFGRWTLFIDGVETGHADNARAAAPVTDARPFILGGRANVSGQSFQGKVDCVRVARAALAPAQFMNAAADAQAATDVVALWPLNVEGGVMLDLRDVSGCGNHFAARRDTFDQERVTAVPGAAPVLSNPDASPNFRGDPARADGCALFRDVGGSNRHRSCLMTGASPVMEAVRAGKDFTFECFYRRTCAATAGDECLFLVASGQTREGVRVRFFRRATGFYVWENMNTPTGGDLTDTLIPGTSDADLPPDRWHHVALVHSIEGAADAAKTVWRVYVDGALKGAAEAVRGTGSTLGNTVLLGGRWYRDNNSVNGCLSSARLSNAALAPEDFLCAPRAPSAAPLPATAGYWPLDAADAGLANLADADYPLVAEGTAASASAQARPSIPNAAALAGLVSGPARRNRGAYALGAAGALAAENVGFALFPRRPFTLEGWLRWEGPAGEQDLAVVGGGADGANVRLFVDAAAHLHVRARGAWPCTPFVDAAFDADLAPFAGRWTHLAVVYEPHEGTGAWTLYADGRPLGAKVRNFYVPAACDYFPCGDLRIGSTERPLRGEVDMWRLTEGALASGDFLYAPPGGVTILVR